MRTGSERWGIGLCVFVVADGAQANPLIVDSAPRSVRMVAEDVRVEVGDGGCRGRMALCGTYDRDS